MYLNCKSKYFNTKNTIHRIILLQILICIIMVVPDALAAFGGGYNIPWDCVTYGHYEQDNIPGNGKEPISWYVLEVKGGEALLVSKDCLDCQPYQIMDEYTTWESSSLRAWLNDDFLNAAFTQEEQRAILTTEIRNEDTREVEGGSNTEDKVFLLSLAELRFHMPSITSRLATISRYAKAQGVYEDELWVSGKWWLRSPGESNNHALVVDSNIESYDYSELVDRYDIGVRPAILVDLSPGKE